MASILSPSGRYYLRGEGYGETILKPSNISSPDFIYGIILGTSIESDGKRATITAPV